MAPYLDEDEIDDFFLQKVDTLHVVCEVFFLQCPLSSAIV